jgi:hypothetical protein
MEQGGGIRWKKRDIIWTINTFSFIIANSHTQTAHLIYKQLICLFVCLFMRNAQKLLRLKFFIYFFVLQIFFFHEIFLGDAKMFFKWCQMLGSDSRGSGSASNVQNFFSRNVLWVKPEKRQWPRMVKSCQECLKCPKKFFSTNFFWVILECQVIIRLKMWTNARNVYKKTYQKIKGFFLWKSHRT